MAEEITEQEILPQAANPPSEIVQTEDQETFLETNADVKTDIENTSEAETPSDQNVPGDNDQNKSIQPILDILATTTAISVTDQGVVGFHDSLQPAAIGDQDIPTKEESIENIDIEELTNLEPAGEVLAAIATSSAASTSTLTTTPADDFDGVSFFQKRMDMTFSKNPTNFLTLRSVNHDERLRFGISESVAELDMIVASNTVSYKNVFESSDFTYNIGEKSLKESIILTDKNHPSSFLFSVNLSDFDYKFVDKEIVLYKKGQSGNAFFKLFTIRAPFMVDAQGERNDNLMYEVDGDSIRLVLDGGWLKQASYPVVVDPTIDIEVLTVHSHPAQGEYWDVDFITVGTSDLTIIPADNATIEDDEFSSLKCGDEDRTAGVQVLSGDVIFYPNWNCEEIATVSHLTLKAGNHHLIFDFGGETAEAFNAALVWTGLAGDGLYSTAGNWSTSKVPSAADTVSFDNTCTNCDMTLDVSTTTASFTMASTYSGTITQANGTDFIVTGAFSQSAGTFRGGNSSNTYQGNFTVSGGSYVSATTTTFTSGNNTININTTQTFYNLTFNGAGTFKTISSGDTLIVDNTLTLTDGGVNTGTIEARGDISTASTFDGGTAVIDFANDSLAQTWTVSGGVSPVVRFNSASDASDSVVINAAATFYGATTTSSFSGIIPFSNPSNFDLNFGASGSSFTWHQAAGTFNGGTGTVTIAQGSTFTISGGTYNAASSTVFGTGNITVNVNSTQSFHDLTFNGGGTYKTISTGDTLVVNGTLYLTDGGIHSPGSLQANGDIVQTANFDGGSVYIDFANDSLAQTWTVAGGTGPGFRLDSAADASDSIVINAAATFSGASTTANFVGTIPISNSSNFDLTFGSTAGGLDAWQQAAGTFNGGTGTVTFTWTNNVVISGGTYNAASTTVFNVGNMTINVNSSQTFHNLTLSGAGTFKTISAGDTLVVTGDLNLTDGGLNGTGIMEAQGDVTVASTFDGGTGQLTFSGSANQDFDLTGATSLFNADIVVNKSGGEVNLLSALVMDAASQDITITSGTFDLNGNNLTVNGSSGTLVVQNGGTLKLNGDETITANSGNPQIQTGSTIEYGGTSSYTIKGYSYSNMSISGSGSFSATSGPLTIGNNFTQSAGTFTAAGATTTIGKNITRTGGTFNHNSGTVHLNGSSQTVNDSTSFYNLYKVVSSADTLTFEAGATTTVEGTLTLRGVSGNVLTLESSISDSPWYIDPQSTRSIGYLAVNDSYNSNATVIEAAGTNSTDGGGNTNWRFENNAPTAGSAAVADTGTNTMTISISGASDDTALASLPYIFHNITTDYYFAATSSTSVIFTGLTESTSYTFEVGVYDIYGNSATTSSVSGTTDSAPASGSSEAPTAPPSGRRNNTNISTSTPPQTNPNQIEPVTPETPKNTNKKPEETPPQAQNEPKSNPNTPVANPGHGTASSTPESTNQSFSVSILGSLSRKIWLPVLEVPINSKVSLRFESTTNVAGRYTHIVDCDSDGVPERTYRNSRRNIYIARNTCLFSEAGVYKISLETLHSGLTAKASMMVVVGSPVVTPPPVVVEPVEPPPVTESTSTTPVFGGENQPIIEVVVENRDTSSRSGGAVNGETTIDKVYADVFVPFVDYANLAVAYLTASLGLGVLLGIIAQLISEIKNTLGLVSENYLGPVITTVSTLAVVTLRSSLTPGLSNFTDVIAFFSGLLRNLFVWLHLRTKRRYWGTVYDSESKQPIDPAIVNLVDITENKVVEEAITDLYGRFGFLDRLGKFKITAAKTHYSFPSRNISGKDDGIYQNIYRGEEFEIKEIDNVITPNIPMDPEQFDWNQQAKQKYVKFHPVFDLFIMRTLDLLSFVSVSVVGFLLLYNPSVLTSVSFVISFAVVVLSLFLPPARLWGKLNDLPSGMKVMIYLYPKALPTVVVGKAHVDVDGRYFLKSSPGNFILKIINLETGAELHVSEVKISGNGVLNQVIDL